MEFVVVHVVNVLIFTVVVSVIMDITILLQLYSGFLVTQVTSHFGCTHV